MAQSQFLMELQVWSHKLKQFGAKLIVITFQGCVLSTKWIEPELIFSLF